ncbi:MAG: tRNA pseudouridine(55) synthase TruB [Oscillatoriales cyanobacterium SM2_2_1]|nr:tRNA pseudouridine(55) synthase TruB [Oscillatoriales cyanobacterium SM2_2_1]
MKSGFIVIDKPAGLTSHGCVAHVRRQLGGKGVKVGHSGTLDPMATGVLVIGVGKATRLLSWFEDTKTYQGTLRFGMVTSTDDITGQVIEQTPTVGLTLEQVSQWQASFVGEIQQRPPMVSALRQGGKRLYELAREGKTVAIPEREVSVERITVLGWRSEPFWELDVEIHCGGGTYIRSIARDWGAKLGCGGTLAALRRTMSNGLHLKDAVCLAQVTADMPLLPLDIPFKTPRAVCGIAVTISPKAVAGWFQGRGIVPEDVLETSQNCERPGDSDMVLVYSPAGQIVGVGANCGVIVPRYVLKDDGDA